MYSEVLSELRKQHAMNTEEICGKQIWDSQRKQYYDEVQGDTDIHTSWTFSFKSKLFLFLGCIMLFSCYLYGGKDVKKGAVMAWTETNTQIKSLQEENVYVDYVVEKSKDIYSEIKEFLSTYFAIDE